METPASCTPSSARPTLLRIAAIIYLAAAVFAAPVRAGNIFDDDWTPPKPAAQPKTAPSPAPESPPNPTNPSPQNPPVATPPAVGQPSAAPAPPARREIPGRVEQARSRALLKQAFADQLKDRTLAGRKKLAQALLDEVPKTADNPSDEYVLLGGAIEASKESGHLKMCFQAADILASQYDVNGLNVKTDAVLKMNLHGDSTATAADNVQAALDLIDPLLAAEDFVTAGKILKSARTAATGDQALSAAVQKRMAVVEGLRLAHDRVAQSLEKLKASPNDAAANLAVGSYLCFNKAEWEKGLPLLAKGSDPNLKQAATLELAHPADTADQVRLADEWWDVATKQSEALRAETMHHAAGIYTIALKAATGLKKTMLERRIAQAAALAEGAKNGVASGPDSMVHPRSRVVVFFPGTGREEAVFRKISNGQMRAMSRPDSTNLLANPDGLANVGILVLGNEFLRDTPAASMTENSENNLRRFVDGGGDLVVFEQQNGDPTRLLERLFSVKVKADNYRRVTAIPPRLAAAVQAAGLTDDIHRNPFNSCNLYTVPQNSAIFLRGGDGSDAEPVVSAGVPFGKGRIILVGNNMETTEAPWNEEVLNYIYGFKNKVEPKAAP